MRIELLGAIGLTLSFAAACGGSDSPDLGASPGFDAGLGAGGSAAGAAGTSAGGYANGGFTSGNGGFVNGGGVPGGGVTGGGGFQTGGGQGGAAGFPMGGAAGIGMVTCPATQPNAGDACTGFGTCTYGSTACRCRRSMNGGTARTFQCAAVPDGGFVRPPRPDGGFVVPDGGFTQPTACTQASDCTTAGDVCCALTRRTICLTSAQCTQFGGTPQP